MRMDEIGVFVRVLDEGSFSAAARVLEMPKATVSAKIAALERRLGVTLIQRTTRKLRATDAGQLYLDACRSSLAALEAAEAVLAAQSDEPTGILRVTAPVVLGRNMLPSLIGGYRERYPAVRVDAVLADREVDLVGEGIDLAFRVGPMKDSSLVARQLLRGAGGFFASAAYVEAHGIPRRLEDLRQHQVIGLGRGNSPRRMIFRRLPVDIDLDPVITCDDFYMVRSLIADGLGVGYLPDLMARPNAGEAQLVRVLAEYALPARALYLAYPQQPFVPARVRSFMAYALENAAEWQ